MDGLLIKIKPKVKGISDKYSWNLYKWLKKTKCKKLTVWFNTKSAWDGSKLEFDKNNIKIGQIWIGFVDKGWLHGSSLNSILNGNFQEWANPWMAKSHIDITEWFWKEYIKDGRCIWDRNHDGWLAYDKNRFTYVNKNSRKCNWCGEWQHRKIEKETIIKRHEIWKSEVTA